METKRLRGIVYPCVTPFAVMKPCPAPHLLFIPTRRPRSLTRWPSSWGSLCASWCGGFSNKVNWNRFTCSRDGACVGYTSVQQATSEPTVVWLSHLLQRLSNFAGLWLSLVSRWLTQGQPQGFFYLNVLFWNANNINICLGNVTTMPKKMKLRGILNPDAVVTDWPLLGFCSWIQAHTRTRSLLVTVLP